MYHDVHEIESGDFALHPNIKHLHKKEKEEKAIQIISEKIPVFMKEKYVRLQKEFETLSSKEARFAKAIDVLDSQLHEVDYKKDWKEWSADFLRLKKAKYFQEFPQLQKIFEELLFYLEQEGYFNQ